jgi:hypothetical protein
MEGKRRRLPGVMLDTSRTCARGNNFYIPLREYVEYRRTDTGRRKVRNLALGRVMLTLEKETGELLGLGCYVRTSQWRCRQGVIPPSPDAEGALRLEYPFSGEDFAFMDLQPGFAYDELYHYLQVTFAGEETALVLKAADCLLVGVSRTGRLTELWMLDLDMNLERRIGGG